MHRMTFAKQEMSDRKDSREVSLTPTKRSKISYPTFFYYFATSSTNQIIFSIFEEGERERGMEVHRH